MLTELDAIAFEYQITFESRTHPWVVLAKKEGLSLAPYVVKLFTKDEVERNYALAKEVFASVIAKEFELSTPEPALLNLSTPEFYSTLSDELLNIFNSKDYRVKFGSRYISGTFPFNLNLHHTYYDKYSDIDTAFAFDNLIYNEDRKTGKPDNIRFHSSNYYLIDHEYSLAITNNVLDEFDKGKWVYDFTNHIFFDCLLLSKDKSNCFNHFESKLAAFDPNVLDPYKTQLVNCNFNPPFEDYQLLKKYLNHIKANSKKFTRILEKVINK